MIRQHDVQVVSDESEALAEGTFRVVMTRGRQVLTVIDLPDSALGPLHLVFAVSPRSMIASSFGTGSIFSSVAHAVEHAEHGLEKAAESTFNAASTAATTLARPAFDIARDAAATGASLVAHVPFVPPSERNRIEAASRTILRARLGDINARQFVHAIGQAAKAGVREAQHAGDALLTGTRIVGRVLDAPLSLVDRIPKVGGVLHSLDPFVKMDHMTAALQRGDFKAIEHMIENDAKMAQGVISLIPGIGTGISAAISAGTAILEGGGALDIAIQTAYGAIPIPPGIREVTDAVLESVIRLIRHPHDLTDAVITGARNAVPSGLPRDVFDTLAKIIFHHMPITHVAEEVVGSYVKRYAGDIVPAAVTDAVGKVGTTVHEAGKSVARAGGAVARVGGAITLGAGAARGGSGGVDILSAVVPPAIINARLQLPPAAAALGVKP